MLVGRLLFICVLFVFEVWYKIVKAPVKSLPEAEICYLDYLYSMRFFLRRQRLQLSTARLLNSPRPSASRLSGFLSADGRVSVGRLAPYTPTQKDQQYEENKGSIDSYERCHWNYLEGVVAEKVVSCQPSKKSPLGLSSVSNHQGASEKRRYGLRGITLNGMRRVRTGAYLLQKRYGCRLGFYTLTCPYTLATEIYSYNKVLPEIARRFFQECKFLYEELGCVWSNVFVYEYQESRYEQTGVPVLHIHYIAPCYYPNSKEFILSATEIRYLWQVVCSQVMGVEADTSASVDAQVVRKSAAGYLAKYLSKGGSVCEYLSETCPSQMPSQWWGMTRNVRNAIRKTTTVLSEEISSEFISGRTTDKSHPLYTPYLRYIDINLGADIYSGQPINLRVGVSARLNAWGCKMLQTWTLKDLSEL